MSEPIATPEKRWKVTLVDRMTRPVFFRRPRTKKRRIIAKWMKVAANWHPAGPLMVPVGVFMMLGEMATKAATKAATKSSAANPSPYWDEENPSRPRMLEMHTLLWEQVKAQEPEFATRCDLFRRVKTLRDGIEWNIDEPIPT